MKRPVNIIGVDGKGDAKGVEWVNMSVHSMQTLLRHVDVLEAFLFHFFLLKVNEIVLRVGVVAYDFVFDAFGESSLHLVLQSEIIKTYF